MINVEFKCSFEIDISEKDKLIKKIRREIFKVAQNIYIEEKYSYEIKQGQFGKFVQNSNNSHPTDAIGK